MAQGKKLPKNVVYLGLVSLFNDVSSEMVYPLIPLFLVSVLKASATTLGIIEGVAEATAGIMKVFSGYISDKLNARKSLTVLGYSLSAFTKPILAFAIYPFHVLLVRFADRFGKGIRTAPRDALIAKSAEGRSMGRVFGFHRTLDNFGAAVGPLIAFALLQKTHNNFRLVFLLSFVASVVAIFFLVFKVKEVRGQVKDAQQFDFNFKKLPRVFYLFTAAIALFTVGNSSDAFLILKAQNVGIATALIPVVYFLYNITYAGLSYPAGILADKLGKRKMIVFGLIAFALVYSGFAVVKNPWLVTILFIVYGFYSAATDGSQRAYLAGIVDKKYIGTAYGIFNTATAIALLPASIVGGWLWQQYGPSYTFHFGSFMALVAILIFGVVYLYERKERRHAKINA
jgi:MFS family permease